VGAADQAGAPTRGRPGVLHGVAVAGRCGGSQARGRPRHQAVGTRGEAQGGPPGAGARGGVQLCGARPAGLPGAGEEEAPLGTGGKLFFSFSNVLDILLIVDVLL
jgi:hypothetical protein